MASIGAIRSVARAVSPFLERAVVSPAFTGFTAIGASLATLLAGGVARAQEGDPKKDDGGVSLAIYIGATALVAIVIGGAILYKRYGGGMSLKEAAKEAGVADLLKK